MMMSTLINATMNPIVGVLRRSGLLAADLDYHIVRASMVIMFFFFGYQKWWAYEADRLEPFISNGPLIWWLYSAFGHQGASWFLGVCEWTFGALLVAGFWNIKARRPWRRRFDRYFHCDRHHHPLYAGRLGPFGRRISGDDG
jgi:uncharacterized membrane protein YkgB